MTLIVKCGGTRTFKASNTARSLYFLVNFTNAFEPSPIMWKKHTFG